MKIALDAMGGDNAPDITVHGAVKALATLKDVEVILVGDEKRLAPILENIPHVPDNLQIHHASQVIEMHESPVEALRAKKDSSIKVAAKLCKEGAADAFVSAGNTGAVVAAATLYIGLLKGVKRPGITATLPTMTGHCLLLDVGANIKCKPLHLVQYGIMADIYARFILGKASPKVKLLNVGEENAKGNELVKETYSLLEKAPLQFAGNIEGRDIFKSECDVVVCEGFVGNVIIKLSEGLADFLMSIIKEKITGSARAKFGALLCKPAFNEIKERTDYRTLGAVPLLGVNGACLICHGGSDEVAISNAIKAAADFVENHVNNKIEEAVLAYQALVASASH